MDSIYYWIGAFTFWAAPCFVVGLTTYLLVWRLMVWVYSAFKIYAIFPELMTPNRNGLYRDAAQILRYAWRSHRNDDLGNWYIQHDGGKLYLYGARLVKCQPMEGEA